jgi:hypothetical protein
MSIAFGYRFCEATVQKVWQIFFQITIYQYFSSSLCEKKNSI